MKIEKTPLILIPALMADKRLYTHQIENLGDIADITVPSTHEFDNISDMAEAILKNAPEQFALAGVSMGGYVALEIMRKAPSRVTKLALINTKAGHDTEELLAKRQAAVDGITDENFTENMRRAVANYVLEKNNVDGRLVDLLVDMAEKIGIQGFKNQQNAIINRIDSTPFLKDIQAKTMIVCGRDDVLLDSMREMHAEIPLSRMSIIEECAHLSPIEQPIALTALVRYWLS